MDAQPGQAAPSPLRVTFVTGVTPDKWVRAWRRRSSEPLNMTPVEQVDQLSSLRDGTADMAFVRLPVDRTDLHVIPLYHERPVVVVSAEHPVAAYDEIPVADLADEHLLQDPDDVPAWRDLASEVAAGTRFPVPTMTLRQTVESVAAQAGILVVPMAVARLHHRRDVVAVPVTGIDETQIGLAWLRDAEDPRIESFVGVVRGRSERSSRGSSEAPPVEKQKAKAGKPARPPARSGKPATPGKGKRRR